MQQQDKGQLDATGIRLSLLSTASFVLAFQENREALMAALSERECRSRTNLQSLFTTQNKDCHVKQAHKSALTFYKRNVSAVQRLLIFHGWRLLSVLALSSIRGFKLLLT